MLAARYKNIEGLQKGDKVLELAVLELENARIVRIRDNEIAFCVMIHTDSCSECRGRMADFKRELGDNTYHEEGPWLVFDCVGAWTMDNESIVKFLSEKTGLSLYLKKDVLEMLPDIRLGIMPDFKQRRLADQLKIPWDR